MDNEHICYRCDKSFTTKYSLNRHLNKKLPCDNKIIELKCSTCLKLFSNKQNLKTHQNKKICKPPDLELLQNKILALEQKQKQMQITNNTQNNNTNNNIICNNNYFLSQEEMKNHMITNCYTLNDIKQIVNNEKIYDYLDNATVDKDHDEDDVLQNTKEIILLIKYIFCNIEIKQNFILYKDIIENIIYIRLTEDIQLLTLPMIYFLIYALFIQLLKFDNLDNEMEIFFKKYIKKYDNQDFMKVNSKEIKNFGKKIEEGIELALIELYEDLKNYKNSKLKILYDKKIKTKNEIKKNKSERHTKLLEEDKKSTMKYNKDISNILYKLYKDDPNYEDDYKFQIISKTYFYEDIKYIKLLSYFINDLYISNKKSKIKYENKSFYYYSNTMNTTNTNTITTTKWIKKTLIELYGIFINEMIDELYKYKILIILESLKKNNNIDHENDYYEFKEYLLERPYQYILKYMIINKISEINITDNIIEKSIISI